MIVSNHTFLTRVVWRGGPLNPAAKRFSRAHTIEAEGLAPIEASAARVFHGDRDRWNPEQLLISSVAQCHMMTFLFLAKREGIGIASYRCEAEGTLTIDPDGIGGEFTSITLRPYVEYLPGGASPAGPPTDETCQRIEQLHDEVGRYCFIARSVAVPITVHSYAVEARSNTSA